MTEQSLRASGVAKLSGPGTVSCLNNSEGQTDRQTFTEQRVLGEVHGFLARPPGPVSACEAEKCWSREPTASCPGSKEEKNKTFIYKDKSQE